MRNPRVAVCGNWGLLPVFSSLPLRVFACLLLAAIACAMPGSSTATAFAPHGLDAVAGLKAKTCGVPRDCAANALAEFRDAPPPPPRDHGDDTAPGKRRTQARVAPVDDASPANPPSPLLPLMAAVLELASLHLDAVPPRAAFAHPFSDATRSGRVHLRASRGRAPPLA